MQGRKDLFKNLFASLPVVRRMKIPIYPKAQTGERLRLCVKSFWRLTMPEARAVQENPLVQGQDEKLTYTLTVTPWGSDPVNAVVTAYDVTWGEYTDVSETVLNGMAAVAGDVITLPSVENLTAGHNYRIEILWQSSGNTFECFVDIKGER
jgi:hypothetical protein